MGKLLFPLIDLHGEIYKRKISVSGLGLALFGSFFSLLYYILSSYFHLYDCCEHWVTVLFFNDHSGRNKHWLVLEL